MAYRVEQEQEKEVKQRVQIPQYFYNIIVPQLQGYYSEPYPVNFDARPVVKCCLHDEDTPSMRYYEDTNSFYCFGCRAGGDVIQLHRLFTERQQGKKPTYAEQIYFLHDFFIKGKSSPKLVRLKPKAEQGKVESQTKQTIRYNKYVYTLEQQLAYDNQLSLSVKRAIWEEIDTVESLLSLGLVNAEDCREYLMSKVREHIR